jgi:hypothetical protein
VIKLRVQTRNFKPETIKHKDVLPPYYIVITQKNQVLLSFLRIKAVINGKEIYSLINNKPVVVKVMENNPKVVITDGYHVTKPVELVYHHLHTYYFKVVCVIDNTQLLAGFFLMLSLFLIGFFSGLFIIKMASILPVLYFLFYYYINRKDFLQITPV